MNPMAAKAQDEDGTDCEVLSADEENALCLARQIVEGIRSGRAEADIDAVERALIGAGASAHCDRAGPNLRVFTLCNALIAIRIRTRPEPGVEVSFGPELP